MSLARARGGGCKFEQTDEGADDSRAILFSAVEKAAGLTNSPLGVGHAPNSSLGPQSLMSPEDRYGKATGWLTRPPPLGPGCPGRSRSGTRRGRDVLFQQQVTGKKMLMGMRTSLLRTLTDTTHSVKYIDLGHCVRFRVEGTPRGRSGGGSSSTHSVGGGYENKPPPSVLLRERGVTTLPGSGMITLGSNKSDRPKCEHCVEQFFHFADS